VERLRAETAVEMTNRQPATTTVTITYSAADQPVSDNHDGGAAATSSPASVKGVTMVAATGTVPHPLSRISRISCPSTTVSLRQHQSREQTESGVLDYMGFMARLKQLWSDIPDLTISYRDLMYDIPVPVKDPGVPNLAKSLIHPDTEEMEEPYGVFSRTAAEPIPNTGIVRPREMTLVLAPPGHGNMRCTHHPDNVHPHNATPACYRPCLILTSCAPLSLTLSSVGFG
jgi:hypothetical protein